MTAPQPGRLAEWRERWIVEERYVPASARRRLYLTAGVLVAVGTIVFTTTMIGVVTQSGFHDLDAPVEAWFNGMVTPWVTDVMIVLAILFGPVALPIIVLIVVVGWILLSRHLWRPLLLAAGMLAGVVLAQVIARLVDHPRPPIGLMLFGPDRTFSFPSGHVLGTADFLLIVTYLLASRLRRTWFTVAATIVAILAIVAQIVSRLYLGYHWISDTVASVALSCVLVGIVIAIDVARTVRVAGEPVTGPLSQVQRDGT